MKDNPIAATLTIVIATLVGSTVAILALANVLISDSDYSEDTVIQKSIEENIKPIGTVVVVGEMHVEEAETPVESVSHDSAETMDAPPLSGEQLYTQVCVVCHATAVLNAPKLGDKAIWAPRIAKGIDQLYANAINGIGTMPPKGGRIDFSDEEIKKAVDHMLESVQ